MFLTKSKYGNLGRMASLKSAILLFSVEVKFNYFINDLSLI